MIGTETDRDVALIAAHVEPHPARPGAAELAPIIASIKPGSMRG